MLQAKKSKLHSPIVVELMDFVMETGRRADHAGSPLLGSTTVRRPMKPSWQGEGKPTMAKGSMVCMRYPHPTMYDL